MAKEKRKADKPLLQHLWDEYVLFKRPFYYESPLALEQCASNIDNIHEDPTMLSSRQVRGHITHQDNLQVNFRIEADWAGRYDLDSADIRGQIHVDEGRTIVTGEAITSGMIVMVFWIVAIGGLAAIFALVNWDKAPFLCVVWALVFGTVIYLWTSFRSRNHILRALEHAIGIKGDTAHDET